MIIYSPSDGDAFTTSVKSNPRHCFLMTRLGSPVSPAVKNIRAEIERCCRSKKYKVFDASTQVSGGDFLVKIWKMVASSPLAVGVVHKSIPAKTQANIFYEFGVAQAMGKETVIVRSPGAVIPSDFSRSEYIPFDTKFTENFTKFLSGLDDQAEHYETVAYLSDRNPVLALDYLKRAYLITGDEKLKEKAKIVVRKAKLDNRAKNSVELLSAAF